MKGEGMRRMLTNHPHLNQRREPEPSIWSELFLALAVAVVYVLLIVGGIGLALYLTW
jgi:hypothetical protein